jgi:hypothetical protein
LEKKEEMELLKVLANFDSSIPGYIPMADTWDIPH